MVQPLWKTVGRCLRKLKIELPFDPAIPLLGIYPEKTMTHKDTCTPMFTAALFAIAKCPSTEEWTWKMGFPPHSNSAKDSQVFTKLCSDVLTYGI